MANWWEAAPLANPSPAPSPAAMQPMVAHTPKAPTDNWWESAPLAESQPPPGPPGSPGHPLTTADLNGLFMTQPSFPRDVDPGPSAAVGAAGLAGLGAVVAGPAALATAARAAMTPVGVGLTTGIMDYAASRDPVSAIKSGVITGLLARAGGGKAGVGMAAAEAGASRSLTARLLHLFGRSPASKIAPEIPLSAETEIARLAAGRVASAAERAAPAVAEAASPVATEAAQIANATRTVAPVAPPIVDMAGNPSILTAEATAARQAARAVPQAVAEAAPAAEAESELATQLRESIRQAQARKAGAPAGTPPSSIAAAAKEAARVPMKATPEMMTQVERKVLTLRQAQGLSRPQIAASIRELYGTTPAEAEKVVEMVLQTHGIK